MGLKTVPKIKLEPLAYSQIVSTSELILIDLTSVALRKLGITRAQLIDTEKDAYSHTRNWANAFHAQCPNVQGLMWVSRQDDGANAIVLFEDRIAVGTLVEHAASARLTESGVYMNILTLAQRIDVKII